MKTWFQENDIEMHSTHNEGKSVLAERFVGTLWHEGLLLKLSLNDIFGNLLKLLHGFLCCCKQRVFLNGKNSSWENDNVGVPQGSILGPLLFLIYINEVSNGVSSNCKLFADDTSVFSGWRHPFKCSYLAQWPNNNK